MKNIPCILFTLYVNIDEFFSMSSFKRKLLLRYLMFQIYICHILNKTIKNKTMTPDASVYLSVAINSKTEKRFFKPLLQKYTVIFDSGWFRCMNILLNLI